MDRDDVAAFGLPRRDRQKALQQTAEAIRVALNTDDAPDRVIGVLSLVVRQTPQGRPEVGFRSCNVWGEHGLRFLSDLAAETLSHVAMKMGATIQRKREGN